MRADLQSAFAELEARRLALLERLAAYSDHQLGARPAPGAWSIAEVVEHLVLAERATLEAVGRQSARPPLRRRWYHQLLGHLVARVLESSIRVPVTGRILEPGPGTTLAASARAWDDVRSAWRSYLATVTAESSRALVFRHPLGVPMTAAETLIFLRRHFDHHMHQVARIERSAAFRAAARP